MTEHGLDAPNPHPRSNKRPTTPPRGSSSINTRPATTRLKVAERQGRSQQLSRNGTAPLRGRRTRSAKYLLRPLRSPYEAVRSELASLSSTGKRRSICLGGFVARGPKKENIRSMLPWWPGAKQLGHRLAARVDATTEVKKPPGPHGIEADASSARYADTLFGQDGHEASVDRGSFEAAPWKEQRCSEDEHTPDRLKHNTVEFSTPEHSGCISDADFSSLFDSLTPPVPIVDQYINDDNLLYEAITKRGRTEALPVNNDGHGVLGLEKVVGRRPSDGGLPQDVELETLLFSDEDIDKLLFFFDGMGCVDGKITLEEMITGFRKIKREWATLRAEEAGRAVLQRLVRLMERTGMSLETWFAFMDSSQRGLGDGKLTPLELRVGFQRLAVHIARIECCCRTHKCNRPPNYGFPPAGATTSRPNSTRARLQQHPGSSAMDALVATTAAVAHDQRGTTSVPSNDTGVDNTASETVATSPSPVVDVNAEGERGGRNGAEDNAIQLDMQEGDGKMQGGGLMAAMKGDQRGEEVLKNAGKAISCREHALEGMVHLESRHHPLRLEDPNFTSKEIAHLMRFIDTNVNFDLDIEEVREAIARVQAAVPTRCPTREAGNLLHVLERHMHKTGARFTDLFFCMDRNGNGYIERQELRTLFERLSREPARRKAKAKLKAEHAQERVKQKEERELQAREAFYRLETYKKAGVFAVLKRIEVWQARSGKRLSEAFHGGGDRDGHSGLDADELAAFMRHLELDLSLGEAVLVLRHLDVGKTGSVEVHEVASAVRSLRRDEGIIRAAQRCADSNWVPPSMAEKKPEAGFSTVEVDVRHGVERGVLGGGRGGDEGWAAGLGVEGFHSPAGPPSLLPDGPVVFRPPIEAITHGRSPSAPARGNANDYTTINNKAGGIANVVSMLKSSSEDHQFTPRNRPEPALEWPPPQHVQSDTMGGASPCSRGAEGSPDSRTRLKGGGGSSSGGGGLTDGMTSLVMRRPATSRCRTNGANSSLVLCQEEGDERGGRGVGNSPARCAGANDSSSSRLSARRVRERLAGGVGWWPGALSAVEDGARLNIYTGSVLDGRWLDSLDSRLSATVRATRR